MKPWVTVVYSLMRILSIGFRFASDGKVSESCLVMSDSL